MGRTAAVAHVVPALHIDHRKDVLRLPNARGFGRGFARRRAIWLQMGPKCANEPTDLHLRPAPRAPCLDAR